MDKKIVEQIMQIMGKIKRLRGIVTHSAKTVAFGVGALFRRMIGLDVSFIQVYGVECYRMDGSLRWRDTIHNLVVNEGLTDMLEIYYRSSAHTSQHYVFITDADPVFAPGDTMAIHPGWVEFTEYAEAARPALVMGPAANQSIDNSASKASYSINQDAQVTGGAGVTDDSTKGGATGLLVGGGVYDKGNKNVDDGDTILVTVQATNSSS